MPFLKRCPVVRSGLDEYDRVAEGGMHDDVGVGGAVVVVVESETTMIVPTREE